MSKLKVIWLNGMPRSGTSWTSQIFDSHPDVKFRLAPLFSYRFKKFLDENSDKEACKGFIKKVYNYSGDEFMEQLEMKREGHYPNFDNKNVSPSHLVMKHTRFHNLTNMLLKNIPNIKLVHIVRNPCATISSWLNTPNEFPPEDDPFEYWRNGENRKIAKEEFWGFNDWIELTRFYEKLTHQKPKKVTIIRYENLVKKTFKTVSDMFAFCGISEIPDQTSKFLKDSKNTTSDNKYSVYRGQNDVLSKWKQNLPESIQQEIYNELQGTSLEKYLE
jgi:hypothetical protein